MIDSIKKKALEDHIPIIMDDTLEVIEKYLVDIKPKKMLEIGTAVRILGYMLCKIFSSRWNNRYNRKRRTKNKRCKNKYKKYEFRR